MAGAGVNAQSTTSYVVDRNDREKLITLSNSGPVAVTVPQASGTFGQGFTFYALNRGVGTVTFTGSVSLINGAATLQLAQGQGTEFTSDGANWQATTTGGGVTGPKGEKGDPGSGDGVKGDAGTSGPVGDTGPKGDKGDIGDTGATGETGPQGVAGPAGADGATGPSGEIGPQGTQGEPGPTGLQGEVGAAGAQGEQGIQGVDGAAGPTGADGTTGATGATGPQGLTGDTGSQGATGATGAQGSQGDPGTPLVAVGVPASASASGITGQVAWDGLFFYVCVDTNTWQRAALATWI